MIPPRMHGKVFVMTPPNEFRITGLEIGESPDSALHESMLDNPEAEAMSELMAVKQALKMGMSIEDAVHHFAGDLARERLIEEGIMTIPPDKL